MKKNNLSNVAVVMFIMLLLSKILGLLRDVLLAYRFGTSYINDAYTVAIAVSNILFAIFVSGFSESYIPFFVRLKAGREKNVFFSNIISVLVIISFLVAIFCCLNSDFIVKILAPGFYGKTAALAGSYISIIVWAFPFYAAFSILSAHLQIQEKFSTVNFCNFIVVNIMVILSILASSVTHNLMLVIGYVIAEMVSFIILLIYFIKVADTCYRPEMKEMAVQFISLIKLAIPVGLSFMMNQLNAITDQFFSSMLGNGTISSLSYANKIQSLFLALTTVVFMKVCFPRITFNFAKSNKKDGLYYVEKGYLMGIFLTVPFSFIIVLFSKPIVLILFERGAFNSEATNIISGCLKFYALGIPFYAFSEIQSRTLTAAMKQKYILKNTIVVVVFNIILDYILMQFMGINGLALATSLSGILMFLTMARDLQKLRLTVSGDELFKEGVRIVLTALLSGIVSFGVYLTVQGFAGISVSFIISVITFGSIYILGSSVFNIAIFKWMLARLLNKG